MHRGLRSAKPPSNSGTPESKRLRALSQGHDINVHLQTRKAPPSSTLNLTLKTDAAPLWRYILGWRVSPLGLGLGHSINDILSQREALTTKNIRFAEWLGFAEWQ